MVRSRLRRPARRCAGRFLWRVIAVPGHDVIGECCSVVLNCAAAPLHVEFSRRVLVLIAGYGGGKSARLLGSWPPIGPASAA